MGTRRGDAQPGAAAGRETVSARSPSTYGSSRRPPQRTTFRAASRAVQPGAPRPGGDPQRLDRPALRARSHRRAPAGAGRGAPATPGTPRELLAVSDNERVLAYPVARRGPGADLRSRSLPSPPPHDDEILNASLPAASSRSRSTCSAPSTCAAGVVVPGGVLLDRDGNFVWRDASLLPCSRDSIAVAPPGRHGSVPRRRPESLAAPASSMRGSSPASSGGRGLLEALEATGRPFAVMPIPPFADSPQPAQALVGYQLHRSAAGDRVDQTSPSRWAPDSPRPASTRA